MTQGIIKHRVLEYFILHDKSSAHATEISLHTEIPVSYVISAIRDIARDGMGTERPTPEGIYFLANTRSKDAYVRDYYY